MIELALQPVANQELSLQLDGSRYVLTIKEANGVMCATVVRDGTTLIQGARIVAKTPLLPYDYLQTGNFVLSTTGDALPYYPEFGVSQSLAYVSAAEIEELRGT